MTISERLYKAAGCEFCTHSAGYHACRYTKNHPSNQSAPRICENGNMFSLNPNINQKVIDDFLEYLDNRGY